MRDVISSDVEIDEHEMDDDGEDSNEPSSRNHLSTSNYHQCDEYDDSTIFAMEQDDDFVDKSVRCLSMAFEILSQKHKKNISLLKFFFLIHFAR